MADYEKTAFDLVEQLKQKQFNEIDEKLDKIEI